MANEITNVEKMRSIPWRIGANSANTIFAQFTYFGSVFVLFLSQLGFSKTQIGFLLSLFPFFGLVALFISPTVARVGYKTTFLTFWGLRDIVTAFLLLTPWILANYGFDSTLIFVTLIVAIFALCRAIAETGWYPWAQDMIPNSMRGKFQATNEIFTTLIGLLAVFVAGFVIERSSEYFGFSILIGMGVIFGLASVWAYSFIPGGKSEIPIESEQDRTNALLEALKDKGFLSYLIGVGLVTLATVPMISFLPLFMQEQIGLSDGQVVVLQNGTLLGGLLSGYLWGWAADRYGRKPVMLWGVIIRIFLPISWVLMPRQSLSSLYIALGIAVFQGIANTSWLIGSNSILYVSIVPPEKKNNYMALYYAWIGLVGGFSQIIGGTILDYSQGLSGQLFNIELDPYLPLCLIGLSLPLLSLMVFRKVRDEGGVSLVEFTSLFLRGNPFLAMGSLIRFHLAKDEHSTVLVTEHLGRSKSRLTVDELLEALADPRFNVRFEAVVSISRMRPDPRLTEALVNILHGSELALSVVAAWALGRIGAPEALEPLHNSLDSKYRSIQVHSARALGALGDQQIAPLLIERLKNEDDKGLQMAFASALGQLQSIEAIDTILSILESTENEGARIELALALARIIGNEYGFIQLLRQVRLEMGTASSQAITAIKRKWQKQKRLSKDEKLITNLNKCAKLFGRNELTEGIKLLNEIIKSIPEENISEPGIIILKECICKIDEMGSEGIEYILLALHTLNSGLR